MKEFVSINSILYHSLFEKGGDYLVAFYCKLKAIKDGRDFIRSADRLKGYNLLRKETGNSVKTLQKYICQLEDMGLCNFSKNGSFYMMGTNKIRTKYKTKSQKYAEKFVRVTIGNRLSDTALNSYKIRLHALEKTLLRRTQRIASQKNIINRVNEGRCTSLKKLKLFKKWEKGGLITEKINRCDKMQLSVLGYGKLKTGEYDKIHISQYWKKRVVDCGFIKSRRQNKFIRKCTLEQFNFEKAYTGNKKLNYFKGAMYEVTPCLFTTTEFQQTENYQDMRDKVKPKSIPKSYLSFDMVAFWENL